MNLEEAECLGEVVEKRGAYSRDQLTHAENVIENASERAEKVTKILKELLLGFEAEKKNDSPSRRLIRTCCSNEWAKLHPEKQDSEETTPK